MGLGRPLFPISEVPLARKMILRTGNNSVMLEETEAANEEELRSLVKDNPNLLPVEEFGLNGPLMVVGRETTLASGAVDLICVTASGDLLVIEFKTGPQNSDFRHSLAQLVHYGSDLWNMSYEVFETTVAVRYFGSSSCNDPLVMGKTSLEQAVRSTWPELTEEDISLFRDRITRQLAQGAFNYVLVASRFTETVSRTLEYMNACGSVSDFFGVELIPFSGPNFTAFESRTIVKPSRQSRQSRSGSTDEVALLEQVDDERHRESLQQLLELCRGLGLKIPWGSIGASIRISTPDATEPLSIGWVFPPDVPGWMGLKDLTLGVDTVSATKRPSVRSSIDSYLSSLGRLNGVEAVNVQGLHAFHLSKDALIDLSGEISDILAQLVSSVNADNG